MKNEIAIKIDNLWKCFKLYSSPGQRTKEILHPLRKKFHKEFWALQNVSLEVKKGETLGIIGRNGSGKSTLLQIICEILPPTKGDIRVNGTISALLELGAGFHPEFTGRDNIYVNGALMGLRKEEIDDRFDEIAKFADIGEYIDQPVKKYSSGMFLRLAFSAAVNVDPDILVIDEALAVGDSNFQKKCYRLLSFLRGKGIAIIIVSHDTNAIIHHCNSSMLLREGTVVANGNPIDVVKEYYEERSS